MGRLRANFARLGNPMQDCHLRKEPALREYPLCRQCCMMKSQSLLPLEEGVAAGDAFAEERPILSSADIIVLQLPFRSTTLSN